MVWTMWQTPSVRPSNKSTDNVTLQLWAHRMPSPKRSAVSSCALGPRFPTLSAHQGRAIAAAMCAPKSAESRRLSGVFLVPVVVLVRIDVAVDSDTEEEIGRPHRVADLLRVGASFGLRSHPSN